MNILIVFGTRHGQTAKIANVMGRTLRELGCTVRVVDGGSIPAGLAVEQFDAVIVGASVYGDRFQPHIVDFVKAHVDYLQFAPSAFFSVSLAEADPDPRAHARALHPTERFLAETGWMPDQVTSFAGSLALLRRRWLMRLFLRNFPSPAPVASAGNVREYTDWDAVARFATEFAAEARAIAHKTVAA